MKKALLLVLSFFINVDILYSSSPTTSYEYYSECFNHYQRDTITALHYVNLWIDKANREQHVQERFKAYKAYLHLISPADQLKFSRYMLDADEQTQNNELIADVSLTIASMYYSNYHYKKALQYHLKAHRHFEGSASDYLIHKSRYLLGLTYFQLHQYDKAASMFELCLVYYKQNHAMGYAHTLHALTRLYLQQNRISDAERHLEAGNDLLIAHPEALESMAPYFLQSAAILAYLQGNYQESVSILEKISHYFTSKKDAPSMALISFYLGQNYLAMASPQLALEHFKDVQQLYIDTGFASSRYIYAFTYLISHYENTGSIRDQLAAVELLLAVDQHLQNTTNGLKEVLHTDYDLANLQTSFDDLHEAVNRERYTRKWILIGVVLALCGLIYYIRWSVNRKKRSFKQLYLDRPESKIYSSEFDSSLLPDINVKVLEQIMKKLHQFEQQHLYLQKEMNLTSLSHYLRTNTRYTASILKTYKQQNIIDYINKLRIDYLLQLFRNDKKYRQYTYKALADEIGFATSQQFVKNFSQHSGFQLKEYLKLLQDEVSE